MSNNLTDPNLLKHFQTIANRAVRKMRAGDNHGAMADAMAALKINPDSGRLWELTALLHIKEGNHAKACKSYEQALRCDPGNALYPASLGALKFQAGDIKSAIPLFEKAVKLAPENLKIWTNYGNVLQKAHQYKEAWDAYNHAFLIDSNNADTLNNLGSILTYIKGCNAALPYFEKAVSLQPGNLTFHSHLAGALFKTGKTKESIKAVRNAINLNKSVSVNLINTLISALNHNKIFKDNALDIFSKAQLELQGINLNSFLNDPADSAAVGRLYHNINKIIAKYKINKSGFNQVQIFRGAKAQMDCKRHQALFYKYGIIPECCFGCYKIVIEPEHLLDHMNVFIGFNHIKLPDENTRKSIIEIRPEMPGHYKSFIYFNDLEKAKKVLPAVKDEIESRVNDSVKITIKRGCSEFALKYPDYNRFDKNGNPDFLYPEQWRAYEEKFDKNWYHESSNSSIVSFNHDGLTLYDALVMLEWPIYANKINDQSMMAIQ